MTKKIGVVTWYNSINYGTCLQAYALVKFLKNRGYDAFIPNSYKFYYNFFNLIEWLPKIIKKFFDKQNNKNNKELFRKRLKKNTDFTNKFCNVLPIETKTDYKNMLEDTEIFITGSDQIWNPYHLSTPFLLSFVPAKKKKIAYSSSIGVSELPKSKINLYKKYLSRFDKIAVREKTAKTILENILKRDIELVLDPVFLLNYAEWKTLFKSNEEMGFSDNEYIFCYFVGQESSWIKDVEEMSKKINLPVKIAVSESGTMPDIGECLPDMGVEEFVSCINNAKYVVTDSFHATALSIIFNKNFIVYKRFVEENKTSQNSRLLDLLDMFNIKDRLINEKNSLENILKSNIIYDNVNHILQKKTEQSVKYILATIEEDE